MSIIGRIKSYFKLIRPKHSVKNILIFLPLVFSANLFSPDLLLKSLIAFIAFSLVASSIYIINDINDREEDRLHPKKRFRPIASGAISVSSARIYAVTLILTAILLQVVIGTSVVGGLLLAAYFVINVLYSVKLKNIPILDVVILSIGFLIRVFYGGEVIGVEISQWLCLVILAFSLYLSLGKRRGEIKSGAAATRKVNKHYTKDFLDKNMYAFLTLTIVFYSLWTVEVSAKNPLLFWTVPLVMIIVMLYSFDIEKPNADGDPSSVLLENKPLLALVGIYGVAVVAIIYFSSSWM